jgi:hypothetical protein
MSRELYRHDCERPTRPPLALPRVIGVTAAEAALPYPRAPEVALALVQD